MKSCFLFSLPYWFYVKHEFFPPQTINIDGHDIIIHSPFRSYQDGEEMVKLPKIIFNEKGEGFDFGPYNGKAIYKFKMDNGLVAYGPHEAILSSTSYYSADTIRLDIIDWHVGLSPNTLFKSFLEILRIKSGQWWIKKFPYGREFGGPLTTILIKDDFPKLPFSQYSPPMRDLDFEETVITNNIWDEAINDLANNKFPPYHKTCLLNAKASLVSSDLPNCVFDLAQTIDLSINHFLTTKWMRKVGKESDNVRKSWKVDDTDIVKILEKDIPKHFKLSFQSRDKASMSTISDFWYNDRNKVLHGKLDKINHTLYDKIKAVENLVSWFEEVLTK